ncbi:MAG TPA: glycosyltransferase family 39 protein [Phycisphaerae bacterium]|nr:glycosyltransferase family 39 protein [Phycisphaerae bacterium]
MTTTPEASLSAPPAGRKYSLAPDVAILLAGAVLLLWGLGDRSLWRSEGRWAEIPREMVLSGDYFHPTTGGELYNDKPLLTYWLRIAAAKLTGNLDEFAVRLPGALAGLIAVGATMWLGRRLWSAPVGWIAGAMLATAWGFVFHARTAEADMENLAAIMLAIAWYWYKRDRPGFVAFLVFWLIAFVGALTKGLTAVIVPVLAILPDIIEHKRWRQVLTLSNIVALILAAAIYFAPFIYAATTKTDTYRADGLALVIRENVTRFFNAFDHKGPPYLYFIALPGLLMPWAPLLIAAVIGLIMIRKSLDAPTRWLAWAAFVIFVFFTLSESRRSYYILPVLPLAALMVGIIWAHAKDARLDSLRWHARNVQAAILIGAVVLALAGPLVAGLIAPRYDFTVTRELNVSLVAMGMAAAVVILLAFALSRRIAEAHRPLWPMFAGTAVLLGGFFCWQYGLLEAYRNERSFVLDLKQRIEGVSTEDIRFYNVNSDKVLFYLNTPKPLAVLRTESELREFMAADRPRVLITQQQCVDKARSCFPPHRSQEPDLTEKVEPWKDPSEASDDLVAWLFLRQEHQPAADSTIREASNEN